MDSIKTHVDRGKTLSLYNFILDLDEEKQAEIQRNKMDKIQEDI
jgi:hypothetical protein